MIAMECDVKGGVVRVLAGQNNETIVHVWHKMTDGTVGLICGVKSLWKWKPTQCKKNNDKDDA